MDVWGVFEEGLRAGAGRPALVEGGLVLDWEAVALRVHALGARLLESGLVPGERVALLARNGGPFLVATFAAAGLRAVLVPLNTRLVPRELAAVLDDAGARVLLFDREHADRAREAAGRTRAVPALLALAPPAEDPAAAPPLAPEPVDPDAPAHLYYTSGTTGRAKGVVLTHRNVVAHAENAIAELGLTRADRWAHVAPMFHLADAWATVALTRVGGVHVMAPRFEPEAALDLLERERVTVTNLVPTMLNAMARHPGAAGRRFPSLRLLLSGGAPIAPALVREVEAVFGCTYAQTYGLTETSPYLTISLLDERHAGLDAEARLAARARTGRPFRGVAVEVVDAAGRPVPPDDRTVGEVRARGETVTPGYWNRPEETAAALRDGWLYTGDLAVIDEHGLVDIVDRKKDMILTGGENVYSTEVEAVLFEHPGVLEAAVFGLPDPHWGEAVTAAVVPRPGAALDPEEVRAFCRGRIAGYKVPRRVLFREALPRTGSGKVAKRLLREGLAADDGGPGSRTEG